MIYTFANFISLNLIFHHIWLFGKEVKFLVLKFLVWGPACFDLRLSVWHSVEDIVWEAGDTPSLMRNVGGVYQICITLAVVKLLVWTYSWALQAGGWLLIEAPLHLRSPRLGKLTFELLWGLNPGRSSGHSGQVSKESYNICPYKPLCEKMSNIKKNINK